MMAGHFCLGRADAAADTVIYLGAQARKDETCYRPIVSGDDHVRVLADDLTSEIGVALGLSGRAACRRCIPRRRAIGRRRAG
jgi:hypothetical protein